MGIIVEEMGRYDPYTDKFIKNTTTDRIEIGTDGNLYRLTVSNDDKFLPIDELYTKANMVAMLKELQSEIKKMPKSIWFQTDDYKKAFFDGIDEANDIIQQKINELKGESEEVR